VPDSLVQQFEALPRYWTSGNQAEVDFLLQYKNEIIPVEVKSDENIRSKSLSVYRKTFSPRISVRYSLRNLKQEDGIINIPLFLADKTSDFLNKLSVAD
jgi:predicted AAA+ superfamily ATPase